MSTKGTGSVLALAALAGVFAPGGAMAQQAGVRQGATAAGIGEVVVTASPLAPRRFDVLQGTSVLSGGALDRALSTSLGATLDRLPGVSQTGFGQGASRPVIRGLSGDRIRVLVGGIGSIDASSTSPDHAPAADPVAARRIEVVRGPGTLLYGSNAIGGVVNILDGRVPTEVPKDGAEGTAQLSYGTNADEVLASASIDVALAGPLVLHADAFARDAGDYEAPGFIRSAPLRAAEPPAPRGEEERGDVENSALDQTGVTGGLSLIGAWGFLGASIGRLDSDYGIPGGHAEEGHEEEVVIDLGQTRVDLIGEVNAPFLAFETARVRFGWADYEHKELEGGEVGTRFLNDGWEGRIELVQRPIANLTGAVGVQGLKRDFRAIGDEAFVPPSETEQWGAFTVQRLEFGRLDLETGIRIERQTVDAEDFGRGFTGISLSGGAAYTLAPGWLAGVALSRTERAPNAEELLSDGPHLATGTFEVGDAGLGEETAFGIEATLKRTAGIVTGAVNLFYTDYDDYIYEAGTGEAEDGLPLVRYTAVGAEFYGFELEAAAEVWRSGDKGLVLDAALDHVRARNTTLDRPLPRIPPLSVHLGAELDWTAAWTGRAEVTITDRQDRPGEFELATGGHTVLNASLDWRPWPGRDLTVSLEGRNLTNSDVRLATSFLKDVLPQPGRDVRLSLRATL